MIKVFSCLPTSRCSGHHSYVFGWPWVKLSTCYSDRLFHGFLQPLQGFGRYCFFPVYMFRSVRFQASGKGQHLRRHQGPRYVCVDDLRLRVTARLPGSAYFYFTTSNCPITVSHVLHWMFCCFMSANTSVFISRLTVCRKLSHKMVSSGYVPLCAGHPDSIFLTASRGDRCKRRHSSFRKDPVLYRSFIVNAKVLFQSLLRYMWHYICVNNVTCISLSISTHVNKF